MVFLHGVEVWQPLAGRRREALLGASLLIAKLRHHSCRDTSGESLTSGRRGCVAGGLGDPAAHRCGCVAACRPDRRPNEQSNAVQGARCCHGCLAAYPGSRDSNKSRVSDPVIRAHVQAPVLTCGFEISCQAPPSRCLKRQKYVPVKCPESDSQCFAAISCSPCSLLFIARGAVTATVFEDLSST